LSYSYNNMTYGQVVRNRFFLRSYFTVTHRFGKKTGFFGWSESRTELDRRIDDSESNPENVLTWEEVKASIPCYDN
jgi:hypothetical protein